MSPERRFSDQNHKFFFLISSIQNIPAEIGAVFWVAEVIGDTGKNDLVGLFALICCGAVSGACQNLFCFILS